MKITVKDVEYVADLSQLTLTDKEKEQFAQDLDKILDSADKLKELDTEGVEISAHVLPLMNIFREDKEQPSMDRDLILKNAPEAQDGCFKVPKVVE
jgi:aspartyl-tRNA(Asn)/glutamyl-tRNA(Gln) amidotransferase subunit C